MAVAKKDDNGFPTYIGLSCIDGVTPIKITVNSVNGGMLIDSVTVTSVVPADRTSRDDNGFTVNKGTSSTNDNVVLPIYVNPATGAVLVEP